ncbi:hypothetical protein SRHO_G00035960 [Serrasalmus rhombeus]
MWNLLGNQLGGERGKQSRGEPITEEEENTSRPMVPPPISPNLACTPAPQNHFHAPEPPSGPKLVPSGMLVRRVGEHLRAAEVQWTLQPNRTTKHDVAASVRLPKRCATQEGDYPRIRMMVDSGDRSTSPALLCHGGRQGFRV